MASASAAPHRPAGPRRPSASPVRAALVLATVALLAGCTGGSEPLPAGEAVGHYEDVAAGVSEALAPSGREFSYLAPSEPVTEDGGTCLYRAGQWESGQSFDGDLTGRAAWDEYAEPVEEVLAEHGFTDLGRVHRRGALHYLVATDQHGAHFELDEQGRFSIADARVDADPCTPETLGIG